MKKGRVSVVILLTMVFVTTILPAAFSADTFSDTSWEGSTDNNWFTGSNWSGSAVPVADDIVDISNGGTAVIGSDDASISVLKIGINEYSSGTLEINNGGTLTSKLGMFVGHGYGSNGIATVSGDDSALNVATSIYVGYGGSGTLNVKDGAVATTRGLVVGYYTDYYADCKFYRGIATVSGTGSSLTTVDAMIGYGGYGGVGVLYVEDGGSVTVAGIMYVGYGDGSSGALSVSSGGSATTAQLVAGAIAGSVAAVTAEGENSNIETGNAFMGLGGLGALYAEDGGTVTITGMLSAGYRNGSEGFLYVLGGGSVTIGDLFVIAWEEGSTGTSIVYDYGSAVNVGTDMYVGYGGTGTLYVKNGGKVTVKRDMYVGTNKNSNGTLNVKDGGSVTATGIMYTGYGDGSVGTLYATGGGNVTTAQFVAGYYAGSIGTVTVSDTGSTLDTGDAYIGWYGTGALHVTGGGSVTAKRMHIGYGYGSDGTATVSGEGSTLDTGDAMIGYEGTGVLDVKDGGNVTATGIMYTGYGYGSDGTATVSGANSSLTTVGAMIGYKGFGTLNVTDGGSVTAKRMYAGYGYGSVGALYVTDGGKVTAENFIAGYYADSIGTVTVSGEDSALDTEYAWIGYEGTGILEVTDGGSVTTGILEVGTRGAVHVIRGGELSVSGYAGNKGIIAGSGTALRMTGDNATVVNSGTITGDTGIVFTGAGNGRLINSGIITGAGGTAVDMGRGDNEVILYTGSVINGNMDGGDGTDSITFDGTGAINSGSALNFESISKTGRGTWTIGGDLSGGARTSVLNGGTLRVDGTFTHEAGGVYAVGGDDGALGKIIAEAAVIKGGTVEVDILTGVRGGRHVIMETRTGLTGAYGTLSAGTNSGYIRTALSYDANNVYLTLTSSFASAALTENQQAVASSLDRTYDSASGDMLGIYSVISTLDASSIRLAFDRMGGAGHTAFAAIDTYRTGVFYRSLFGGPPAAVRGQGPAMLAADTSVLTDADNAHVTKSVKKGPFSLWARGYGITGTASRYDYTMEGAMAGGDISFVPSVRAGFALGYAHTKMDMGDLNDEGSEDSIQAALYGSWNNGRWYTDLGIACSRNSYETTRHIDFGNIRRQARASYNGHDLSGYLEGGYRLFDNITPFFSLLAVENHRDGFTETGAASLDLNAGAASTTSLQGSLGVRLAREFMMGEDGGFSLTPQVSGRWVHEFGDDTSSIDARFTGSPSGSFTVSSDAQDRDSGVFSLGITGHIKNTLSLFFAYDGLVRSEETAHALTGGVRFRW